MYINTIIIEKLEDNIYLYSTNKEIGTITNSYYQKININDFYTKSIDYLHISLKNCNKRKLDINPVQEIFDKSNFKSINTMYKNITKLCINVFTNRLEIKPSKNKRNGIFELLSQQLVYIEKNLSEISNNELINAIQEAFKRST